jgi:hypothetical protein
MDPTGGFLTGATQTVKLVTAIAQAAPAISNAAKTFSRSSQGGAGHVGHAPAASAAPAAPIDPERERRAYETINVVLTTLGDQIGGAGLVATPALEKALQQATKTGLLSVEANRIVKSLGPKLNDQGLVYSIFTSLYFIGELAHAMTISLPNYKSTYPALCPQLVMQLLRSSMGEDVFRENQNAILSALRMLASTTGLLRPTNVERAIFPGTLGAWSDGRTC